MVFDPRVSMGHHRIVFDRGEKISPKPESRTTKKLEISAQGMLESVKNVKGGSAHPIPTKLPQKTALTIEPINAQKKVESVKLFLKSADKPTPSPAPKIRLFDDQKIIERYQGEVHRWFENISKAGLVAVEEIYEDFDKLLDESSRSLLQDSVNQSKLNALKQITAIKEMAFEELPPQGELFPNEDAVESYKELSKTAEMKTNIILKNVYKFLNPICLQNDLPTTTRDNLQQWSKNLKENLGDKLGLTRYKIMQESEIWNPDVGVNRTLEFENQQDQKVFVESKFYTAGPSKSSQANRNCKKEDAVVPNFFHTYLDNHHCTRSAITVEFDVKNEDERREINGALVQKVLDVQVAHHLQKFTWDELTKMEQPIVVKAQTVNLLTPDITRMITRGHPEFPKRMSVVVNVASEGTEALKMGSPKLLRSMDHNLKKLAGVPADDERSLALENDEAHKALDGSEAEYTIVNDATKEEHTVRVRYELSYFNFGVNTLHAKLPVTMTLSSILSEANNNSFIRLDDNVNTELKNLSLELSKAAQELSGEEKLSLENLKLQANHKNFIKTEIMERTINKKNLASTDKQFQEWQKQADSFYSMLNKALSDPSLNPSMQRCLELLQRQENMMDLYLDTKELFLSGLYNDPMNMGNNKSSLVTRLIALGESANTQVHFGCRSGKDRTGIVDNELKLLWLQPTLCQRYLSYREQETMDRMLEWRETMTYDSGNADDLVEANMGSIIGWNIGGAVHQPSSLLPQEKQKEHRELFNGVKFFSGVASRPLTKSAPPPGYLEKFQDKRVHIKS